MNKGDEVNKTKIIILLIILIAIGGLVLYGNPNKERRSPPSFKNLMNNQK